MSARLLMLICWHSPSIHAYMHTVHICIHMYVCTCVCMYIWARNDSCVYGHIWLYGHALDNFAAVRALL